MTSGTNSSESGLSSKKNSKIYDNYLKEMNEDLKLRKQEILEMLKPLEDKNNLLLQKVMANLEEKQKSLQIMRQIMAGRGCDESSVMELATAPEERKQNLEKQQMKIKWVKYEEQPNILQNGFLDKVIEQKIEALRNYQKPNDFKSSLYLQHNFETKQGALNLLRLQEALFSEVNAG
uniref:Coiled-coil domain containing 196 n=1 Tax=Mus spicilegus TaxID=10103 RepID=A0A8C6HJQ3_MUSSI